MSNLPSPHFEVPKLNIWQKLIDFADLLITEFSSQSLLEFIIQLFSQDFSASIKIWLDPIFFNEDRKRLMAVNSAIVDQPTKLMSSGLFEKKIVTSVVSAKPATDQDNFKLAIPLSVKDRVIGAIQLESAENIFESKQNIGNILTLTTQLSMALGYITQLPREDYIRRSIDYSENIAEIRQSIITNLDQSSLINNLVTLLHQKFGYSEVNLLLPKGEKQFVKHIGIMKNGVQDNNDFDPTTEADPISWSIIHRLPLIVNNSESGNYKGTLKFNIEALAECVIPLLDGEETIGGIDLRHDSPDVFGPESLNGLYSLSRDLMTAIRNAKIFHSEHIKSAINERLKEVVGNISPDTSVTAVLQKVIDELGNFIPFDAAAIWIFDAPTDESDFDENGPVLRLTVYKVNRDYRQGDDANLSPDKRNFYEIYYESSVAEEELLSIYPWFIELIDSSYPLLWDDPAKKEPVGEMIGLNEEYSAIGALLSIDGEKLGVLIAVDQQVDLYNDESQATLDFFVSSASIVLKNTTLYEAAHDQAWISTALLQVAEAIQPIAEIGKLFETVANMLPGLLDAKSCLLLQWDALEEGFFPGGSSGFDQEQSELLNELGIIPANIHAFDELVQNLEPVIIDHAVRSTDNNNQLFDIYDFTTGLLILFPIISLSGIAGAILVDFSGSELTLNAAQKKWDEMYALVEGVARQTANSLENLQLYKSQQEETYISIALLQVAQAIVSINKLDEVLSAIVRITPILVGVKKCLIYLWDRKALVFQRSEYYGLSKPEIALLGESIKGEEFPFIEAIQREMKIIYHELGLEDNPNTWRECLQGDYSIMDSLTTDPGEEISLNMDSKLINRSQKLLIGFPISVKGEFLGIMLIEEEDQRKGSSSLHIREKRIEIVQGITQQVAIAIKNDQLQVEAVKNESMSRELELAKEIQSALLPHQLPTLPGWEIEARWRPAHQVSGDFYDLIPLDDNHIGFVIADVADKGIPGALFMTLIRTLLRAAAKDQFSPSTVLQRVNELLVPDSKNSMFVTLFYGVLDLDSGQFSYANAGHNPPVIKKVGSNDFVELPFTSVPLGIFEDIHVDEHEQELNYGDWVFLYTDGITEAFSKTDEMFGVNRLYNLLLSNGYSSSKELLDRVQNEVNEFTNGTEISDDITMGVIYRKPE
jgi:sigma-B regulation protein RsbU (phosphoserine phosphatase)